MKNRKSDGANNGFFSTSVKHLFVSSDHVCINLETTVGIGGAKVAKAYNFQVSPDALRLLVDNHVSICSIANNHSNDYGEQGLQETIQNLNAYQIDYIGVKNHNQKDLLINAKKVRLCSYYGNEKGLARINQLEIINDIKRHKSEVDFVFVCLHWGEEYVAYPSPNQQKMAHALVDAGASVIIAHHPHVMQGFEKYKNGLIFYSLGNFNFFVDHPYAKQLIETTKAYCVGLNIEENGTISHEIIPIHINEDWQPTVITNADEKSRFFKYFNCISKPLENSIGNGFWYAEAAPHYFQNHFPSWRKRIKNYGMKHLIKMMKWLIHPAT